MTSTISLGREAWPGCARATRLDLGGLKRTEIDKRLRSVLKARNERSAIHEVISVSMFQTESIPSGIRVHTPILTRRALAGVMTDFSLLNSADFFHPLSRRKHHVISRRPHSEAQLCALLMCNVKDEKY